MIMCCLGVRLGSWFPARSGGLGVTSVWGSDLVLGSRLDPCHDPLEFIGQSGTGSNWPSRERWRPQVECEVVGTFRRLSSFKRGTKKNQV